MKNFSSLTEQEILALAISNEEEDGRTYTDLAHRVRKEYPATSQVFVEMAREENEHRRQLIDLYVQRFGEHIPMIRRQDFGLPATRMPAWQLTGELDAIRRYVRQIEQDSRRFYYQAAENARDAAIRKLLGDLAAAEAAHENAADDIEQRHLTERARATEDDGARRKLILQVIQPGLVGLVDGSVSTLAPVFAAAFATHQSWNAFVVGLAASLGAGISMGFAEALADDGKLSGRGTPWLRGGVCGLMTTAGGIGHTLPYLIPGFRTATLLAGAVAVMELLAIAWVQWRYMQTPPLAAIAKVMLGGALVLAIGISIGSL